MTDNAHDVGASIIAQSWMDAIRFNQELGLGEETLYVPLPDWNRVADAYNLDRAEARRLPQVLRFMDNPVMVVPELPTGLAYLGRRIFV